MELKEGKKHTCGLRRPFGVAGTENPETNVNGAATVKDSTAGPPTIKHQTYDPGIPLLGVYPKELEAKGLRMLVHLGLEQRYSH